MSTGAEQEVSKWEVLQQEGAAQRTGGGESWRKVETPMPTSESTTDIVLNNEMRSMKHLYMVPFEKDLVKVKEPRCR